MECLAVSVYECLERRILMKGLRSTDRQHRALSQEDIAAQHITKNTAPSRPRVNKKRMNKK
jgi:hypothetical protein